MRLEIIVFSLPEALLQILLNGYSYGLVNLQYAGAPIPWVTTAVMTNQVMDTARLEDAVEIISRLVK